MGFSPSRYTDTGIAIMTKYKKIITGPYKPEIILNGLMLIITIVFGLYFHFASFLGGLINSYEPAFLALMALPIIALLIAVILLIALIMLIRTAVKSRKAKNTPRFKVVLAAIPFIPAAFFIASIIPSDACKSHDFQRGNEIWVHRHADIDAIRTWLASLDDSYFHRRPPLLFASNFQEPLPEAIVRLKPQYIHPCKFDGENRYVEFIWGGGFAHWGLHIGPPDKETPENDQDEFTHSIQPGVYIFDR